MPQSLLQNAAELSILDNDVGYIETSNNVTFNFSCFKNGLTSNWPSDQLKASQKFILMTNIFLTLT